MRHKAVLHTNGSPARRIVKVVKNKKSKYKQSLVIISIYGTKFALTMLYMHPFVGAKIKERGNRRRN